MADLSISELVEAATKGDQDAWDRIVDDHSSLVWAVVRSHGLRSGDADDAFQTTWLRLVENLDRLDRPNRLASWLVTTARRECLRVLRRHGREIPDVQIDQRADGADAGPEPLEALLTREEQVEMLRAFSHLTLRCQSVLRLTVADPHAPYGDVAEALGMPIGSVGPTRRRCLDHLLRLLGEERRSDRP